MTKKWQLRDDKAPHQIRLTWVKTNGVPEPAVGCTCKQTMRGYEPIAVLELGESPWPTFNNPAHHLDHTAPFTKEHQGGPIHTRPPAPEASVQRAVERPLLVELDDEDMEERT